MLEVLAALSGDYDNDGLVGQGDLDLVLLHWGDDADTTPAGWTNDLPSGAIDQDELDRVLLNWGAAAEGIAATSAVPEPSTVMMLAMAWIALSLGRRLRR